MCFRVYDLSVQSANVKKLYLLINNVAVLVTIAHAVKQAKAREAAHNATVTLKSI